MAACFWQKQRCLDHMGTTPSMCRDTHRVSDQWVGMGKPPQIGYPSRSIRRCVQSHRRTSSSPQCSHDCSSRITGSRPEDITRDYRRSRRFLYLEACSRCLRTALKNILGGFGSDRPESMAMVLLYSNFDKLFGDHIDHRGSVQLAMALVDFK